MNKNKEIKKIVVERIQTGIRIEKKLLKVLKGLAEFHDLTLGDLLEGIVLHTFEGKTPFSKRTLLKIQELKKIYDADFEAKYSHQFIEK